MLPTQVHTYVCTYVRTCIAQTTLTMASFPSLCCPAPDVPNGPEVPVSNGAVSPQNGHVVTPSPPLREGVSPIQLAEATRTPEHIESLKEDKYATALRGRRGALRQAKAQEFRGHKFVKKYFRKPTYCAYCKEMFW